MKSKIADMTILGILLAFLFSCDSDGQKTKPNNFNNDDSFIKVAYAANADTVYLSWELIDKSLKFDNYRISLSNPKSSITAGKQEMKCFFTHVPYDELVSVSFSLIDEGEAVKTYKLDLKIDGLDKVIAAKIIPDRGSVTAGDGMYSILLPDGRSIFLMGDCYTGAVANNQRPPSAHMYRNSYVMYDNGDVSAIVDANGPQTSGAVPVGISDEHQDWYWPGHGFVEDNKLYIFQTFMYQGGEGMWGFRYKRTDILEYDLPGMALRKTTEIPFRGSSDIHYGMAALNDGDYIYIYAQEDISNGTPISEVLLARTTIANLYDRWEYYTGSGWSDSSSDAVKLGGLASVPVSSQFNVFKLRDKYVLLTQTKEINTGVADSGCIYTFISDTPYGPWKNKKKIFRTRDQYLPTLFTYNAMAHPQFEKDGMILVSYNVNTSVFANQSEDVSTYRPRFFWAEIDTILK